MFGGNNGAVGDTGKAAGISVVVISSPRRREVKEPACRVAKNDPARPGQFLQPGGEDAQNEGFMADPPSSMEKLPPVPFSAKFRSGSRYTDFVPKPAENLAFPHENARCQMQPPRPLVALMGPSSFLG
jgi:hypothetical protein